MAFPPQFLDEIRNRVSLSELIGRRTKLVKKGREYSGLCPFHNEKTPSFTVNEEKGFYHCFGCGAHGDQVEFVKQTEGLSFRETIERLADMAGMQMPVERPQERAQRQKSATLHDVMEAAAQWYTAQLSTQAGLHARQYLESRQVSSDAQKFFRLGFAPSSRTALKQAMMARKISEDLLLEAGLIIKPEDGRETYDRFRDRLMFPITDTRGRVIAFGGRALGDAPAKYLNSPDTPLFHKGRVLYNMANARPKAFEAGQVLVAEGYMDVIALASYGFEHSVAPLGTAVTEEQLQILWKMAPEPVLCLDGDNAGVRAAGRAAERALPLLKPGHSLRFVLLPDGQDPDDLLKSQGQQAMADLLAQTKPLSDLLWERELEGRQLETPEQKAALEASLSQIVEQIQDPTVKNYYQRHFKNRLWEWGRQNRQPYSGGKKGDKNTNQNKRFANQGNFGRQKTRMRVPERNRAGDGRSGDLLVLTVINHPKILEFEFDEFAALHLSSPSLDRVHHAIIEIASSESELDEEGLKHHLTLRGFSQQIAELEKSAQGNLDWFAGKEAAFEDARQGWKHLLARRKRKLLQDEVELAEKLLGEDLTPENLDRLKMAQKALLEAEGNEADLDGYGVASGRSSGF